MKNFIRKMRPSGSPNPLDEILIIAFKRSPYLPSYLTKLLEVIWRANTIPSIWRRSVTILIHKKGIADDPSNFMPITLQAIPLKVFASALINKLFLFLMKNNYIETSIQKGFTSGMSGAFEHTAHPAHLLCQAKSKITCCNVNRLCNVNTHLVWFITIL